MDNHEDEYFDAGRSLTFQATGFWYIPIELYHVLIYFLVGLHYAMLTIKLGEVTLFLFLEYRYRGREIEKREDVF